MKCTAVTEMPVHCLNRAYIPTYATELLNWQHLSWVPFCHLVNCSM